MRPGRSSPLSCVCAVHHLPPPSVCERVKNPSVSKAGSNTSWKRSASMAAWCASAVARMSSVSGARRGAGRSTTAGQGCSPAREPAHRVLPLAAAATCSARSCSSVRSRLLPLPGNPHQELEPGVRAIVNRPGNKFSQDDSSPLTKPQTHFE